MATAAFVIFSLTVPGDCTAFVVWETSGEDTAGVLDGHGTAAFAFCWLTVTGGDFVIRETTEEDTAGVLDGHDTAAFAFCWLTVTGGDFVIRETTEEDTAGFLNRRGTVAFLGGVCSRTILSQQHSK